MSITWLHISDLHVRGGDSYDRDVVLRALVASVRRYRQGGRAPDLIFVSGDLAEAVRQSLGLVYERLEAPRACCFTRRRT